MTDINYKEKTEEVLIKHYGCKDLEDLKKCFLTNIESETMIQEAMIEFAKQACKVQKVICAEYARCKNNEIPGEYIIPQVNEDSILNAPTVKFD